MAARKISKDQSAESAGVGMPLPPVHAAIINKDVTKMAELIRAGSPQLHPETQDTPLHTATRVGAIDCLRWLLQNRVKSPLDRVRNGSAPAHYAAVYGRLEALKLLVTYDEHISQEIAEQTDDNGLSILSLATLQGDLKMVQWIVDNFANIGHISDSKGNLPIHFAAASGSLAIVKYLVEHYGKDYAEKKDRSNTTPVYYAAQDGKIEVLKYLVDEVGVDALAKELTGMSTIHAASMGHQLEVVKWLVTKVGSKCIVDKTKDGATPLHIAAAHGCSEMLQFFLDNLEDKNDINVLDHIHATPAHDAAEFGQQETLLMLLKHGANISIKDTENKTPLDLAMEKQKTEIARMIGDYRERGVKGLEKYEQAKKGSSSEVSARPSGEWTASSQESTRKRTVNSSDPVRTSRNEAEEISNVIMQASGVIERRKDRELTRKRSMERLYQRQSDGEQSDSDDDDLERQLLSRSDRHGSRRSRSKSRRNEGNEENLLDHEAGPNGQIYTKVKKKHSKPKKNIHKAPEMDDQLSEASSRFRAVNSSEFVDQGYSTYNNHNLETSSNYSRPSRVKNYPDNESEASYRSGSTTASRSLHSGRHNIPGFYKGHRHPPVPPYAMPQRLHKGPRSTSGSSLGSQTSAGNSRHRYPVGYPPAPGYPMAPYPVGPNYPYHPAMVAQYYGYQWSGRPYTQPKPKTTEERMHMEALQRRGHPPWGPAGYPPPPPPPRGYMKGNHRQRMQTKAHHHRPSSGNSGHGRVTNLKQHPPRVKHRDRDIGFGPSMVDEQQTVQADIEQNMISHPAPPPITGTEGVDRDEEVVVQEGNFFLVKPVDGEDPPTLGTQGTRLVRAKRYDQYIMTDSEDEREIPDHVSIARATESALICALAPIVCLQGMQKVRKTRPKTDNDELAHRSSAWDVTGEQMRSRSRRGSFSKDPDIAGLSPHEFANLEEQKTARNWATQTDQQTNDMEMSELSVPTSMGMAAATKEEEWSQVLPKELKPASMSAQLGISNLGGSLRARNFALGQFTESSLTASRMSLDDDDDDDDDIISIIHGIDPSELEEKKKSRRQAKGAGKKDKQKKSKDKKEKAKERGKEKQKNKEDASSPLSTRSKSRNKDKQKTKSEKTKAKDSFTLAQPDEIPDKQKQEKGNRGQKGKGPNRPAPSPPRAGSGKLMTVVPTPPRGQKDLKGTKSKGAADKEKEFKLKSQTVPFGVSVNPTNHLPLSNEPREIKMNFADLDSSDSEKDEDTEEGAVLLTKNKLSNSLEDLFSEAQKKIDNIMADISDMEEESANQGYGVAEGTLDFQQLVNQEVPSSVQSTFATNSHTSSDLTEEFSDVHSLMQHLKITPDQVTPQVMMKLQMVQNILNLKNPELTTDLKNLFDQGWLPVHSEHNDPMESSSSSQLVADLQSKLMETEQQVRSQAAFGQSLEKRLEEQHERHVQSIQELMAQLKEQKEAWMEEKRLKEEEEKKRKKKQKGHRHRKSDTDSDSESVPSSRKGKHKKKSSGGLKGGKYHFKGGIKSDSDSDSELVTPHLQNSFAVQATPPPITAAKLETKTMQAQIFTQDLLKWEDFEKAELMTAEERDIPNPPSPPTAKYLLSAIDPRSRFKRRATEMQLEDHSRAMERFAPEKFLLADDDEDDDETEIAVKSAKPKKGSGRTNVFHLKDDNDSGNYSTDKRGIQLAAARSKYTFLN